MTFPISPTFSDWLKVLNKPDMDEATLRWCAQWVKGSPVLADEPSVEKVWDHLLAKNAPWSEDLLISLVMPPSDGPVNVAQFSNLLALPAAGLRFKEAAGFLAAAAYSKQSNRSLHARLALSLEETDVSKVALILGGEQRYVSLLADQAKLYQYLYRLIVDPSYGGGANRIETFLTLEDEWYGSIEELVQTVANLTPSEQTPPPPPSVFVNILASEATLRQLEYL